MLLGRREKLETRCPGTSSKCLQVNLAPHSSVVYQFISWGYFCRLFILIATNSGKFKRFDNFRGLKIWPYSPVSCYADSEGCGRKRERFDKEGSKRFKIGSRIYCSKKLNQANCSFEGREEGREKERSLMFNTKLQS